MSAAEQPVLHKTLYSPSERKVACALLAAAYGCSPAVHRSVCASRWFTHPLPDMRPVALTPEDLRWLAQAPVEQWPGPEDFETKQEDGDNEPA